MNQVCTEIGPWLRVLRSVKCKCSCAKKRQQTYSGIDESCFGDKIKRSWSATNARNFKKQSFGLENLEFCQMEVCIYLFMRHLAVARG